MNNLKLGTQSSAWLIALLATTLVTGCGGDWDAPPSTGTDPDTGTDPETPVAPTVAVSGPNDNATNVDVNSSIDIAFSEPMDESSINDTTFTLAGPDATPVEGEVTYSGANYTASLNPANALEFGTVYTAVVTTGAETEAGTALAEEHTWTFTTAEEEATAITLVETNPQDGGTVCATQEIRVTFEAALDPETIVSPATNFVLVETVNTSEVDGEVSLDTLGTTATFAPEFDFSPNIEYTATVTTEVTDVNGNNLEEELSWSFVISDSACQTAITLGSTELYGVLSNTGVTLGGGPDSTTGLRVDGDVGIFPEGECLGCDTTTVSGEIEIGNTVASVAMDDLEAAYEEAVNLSTGTCTLIDAGSLATNPSATCGGNADGVFAPGLYWSSTSIAIPAEGTITLDAQNDADAVFIFQSESTISTIGGDTHIILENGAQAKNVFWLAGSSATIGGTNSDFVGTILAMVGVTVNSGTQMTGRALARGAEVTVQDNALITIPAQ